MRAVVQRTTHSQVSIEGEVIGSIDRGLMVLLGVKKGDTQKDAEYITDKIVNLRIFSDDEGKMNRSLLDIKGEILMVSQFTLLGDTRRGRRPGFSDAALPDAALPMFDYCVQYLREMGIRVATGQFGADMQVSIENDGPVTILLDSEKLF